MEESQDNLNSNDVHGIPPTVIAVTEILINRPLGRGGIGEVYVANDRATGRSMAVKFLRPTAAGDESCREAFTFETQVTSQLEHPNIVPVYVTGKTDDNNPFYAMRLIPGHTLGLAIDKLHHRKAGQNKGDLLFQQTALLGQFSLACKALAYAHDRGVVHRDIKPANIMLGRFGEVVVLDWGLATRVARDEKARSSGEESVLMPTAVLDAKPEPTQSFSGTPAYMSPEQHDGSRYIGASSDIYGLGATLYHILTGQPPYAGNVALIRESILAGKLIKPSKIKRGISPAIEAICLKAMSHDPADRYESPLDLANDIEHYVADLPVSAYREPTLRKIARWSRRHRRFVQFSIISLLFLFALTAGSAILLKRMASDEHQARQTALTMAARLAAGTAALQVDSRWRILEHEAQNKILIDSLNKRDPAGNLPRDEWALLQDILEEIAFSNRASVDAECWAICDANGTQVARSPLGSTIGKSFSHRDYFHGGTEDLPVGTASNPLRESHRSTVYKSMTTGKLKVAFSTPIWSKEESGTTGKQCLGVLMMTFDVGVLFHSLNGIGEWNASKKPFAVAVIDLRNDRIDGKPLGGLVLENPNLDGGDLAIESQDVRVNPGIVARLRTAAAQAPQKVSAIDVGVSSDRIAAAEPIIIPGRPANLANIGWAVLVQEREK